MLVLLIIVFLILAIIFTAIAMIKEDMPYFIVSIIMTVTWVGLGIFGCFHGFINHPRTEGTHQGIITAVDLEGVHFRRYEVYLKSSGYTNQSDETKYLIYDYEKDLAEQLQNAIGKTVKLNYGHDGGYIGWKSCGTYHIKSVEIIEEE